MDEKALVSMEQENKAYEVNGTTTATNGGNRTPTDLSHHHSSSTVENKLLNVEEGASVGGSNTGGTDGGGGGNILSDVVLPETVLDKLYHSYSIKQRRAGLTWYLAASILFDIWAIIIPQGQPILALGITGIIALINVMICILLHFSVDSKVWKSIWQIVPYLVWFLSIVQLATYLLLKTIVTARDFLGWGILVNFLVYVTIPIPLVYTGLLLGFGTFTIYLSVLIGLARRDPLFWEQIGANVVLILAATVIGLLYYFLGEAKQKRAFLEAKKSLEVKMVIEEQSAEQERLLLSVLPEHVAVKMRQDLGSTNSEQFKKIYMSRHENVSILYADIVGFTAISSTYSAQDLVKMLNELFARFDRLAEKYQQLRIKILGDCYYCISGAPVERPDHAVLCVHMGLSMVKAIKYVQQKTNSPVDMRVGIHTGAVLAGILGQRQWQFDVYSKDVELANKMESSGKAGRVHISEKTLGFLNGEFEVEPAYGEKREEALRIAGLKTYFIKKVLKPFITSSEQKKNGATTSTNHKLKDTVQNVTTTDVESVEIIPDEDSKANSGDEDMNADLEKDKVEEFKKRLRKELVARDGHGDLSKDTTIFLTFKHQELEDAYASYREPFSSIPLIVSLFVQFIDVAYSLLILPRTCLHSLITSIPILPIGILVYISIAESFPGLLSSFMVKISRKFNDIHCLRRFTAIIIILLIGFTNLIDMFHFSTLTSFSNKTEQFTTTISNITGLSTNNNNSNSNITTEISIEPSKLFQQQQQQQQEHKFNINDIGSLSSVELIEIPFYPSYLSNYCVLILISIAVIAQLSHGCKIFFMIFFTILHCIMNILVFEEQYIYEDQLLWNIGLPMKFNSSAILFVVALSLSFFARHMDKEDRVIFKWKREVAEQKEKASDMRRRNEALVYNVLPVHVAEHFMKNRKRSHDDLYSQSYAEVGVLFASMPNFSDFYSEETVNNQGLECLRFLNEVISDYDALLELPQFQDVIKIKTIGSTYMAASGLNPSRQIKPDDPIIVRWAHLALLVEFALDLKKALQGINEQSFNHFVLKMGINHGPITAGVIGARKPHYDIWGNTVNVASRMESTGKAGCIQVTEETCQILQTFGYTFEQRGLVAVKGKGQLMTYYLQGKTSRPNPPSSPILSNINTMEPVLEVEEPTESPNLQSVQNHNHEKNIEQHQSKFSSVSNEKTTILKLDLDENSIVVNINSENDPRSPKSNTNFILETHSQTVRNGEIELEKSLSSLSPKRNNKNMESGICNETDVEIDVKAPLLNLNSTNLESTDFSINENDSLIVNE